MSRTAAAFAMRAYDQKHSRTRHPVSDSKICVKVMDLFGCAPNITFDFNA